MAARGNMTDAGGSTPSASATPDEVGRTIKVWDPLVRLFHWSLVVCFVVAWVTGDELQRLHELAGYTIVGLLGVRIIWGFVGTAHARFTDFVYRPSVALYYLVDTVRLRARRYLGHNPAGGAMVVALLLMLGATTASGIMLTVSGHWLKEVHELAANVTIVLVGLHLAGVIFACVEHRENLVRAMITGRKRAR